MRAKSDKCAVPFLSRAGATVLYDTIQILLTKSTAAQNEVVLHYYRVPGLYFLAVVFVTNDYI